MTIDEFVDRNVIYCVSRLISELVKKAEEFPEEQDDLYAICRSPDDWETPAYGAGWRKLKKSVDDITFVNVNTHECSTEDDWENLARSEDLDPENAEIYEHWIVDNWFADKLEAKGERIVRDLFGMTIWGRGTTGQAISMDCVVQEIFAELGI